MARIRKAKGIGHFALQLPLKETSCEQGKSILAPQSCPCLGSNHHIANLERLAHGGALLHASQKTRVMPKQRTVMVVKPKTKPVKGWLAEVLPSIPIRIGSAFKALGKEFLKLLRHGHPAMRHAKKPLGKTLLRHIKLGKRFPFARALPLRMDHQGIAAFEQFHLRPDKLHMQIMRLHRALRQRDRCNHPFPLANAQSQAFGP